MARLTLATRNVSAVISNMRRYGERAKERCKVVNAESMERVYATSQENCPVASGYMKEHERKELTPKGFGYSVGFDASDFPGNFYPPYVIFGTRFMPGRDILFSAAANERPRYRRELREALRTKG